MLELQQFMQNNALMLVLALVVILILIFLWNLVLQFKINNIQKKSEIFFAGDKVPNLEELLLNQAKNIKELDRDIQELFNISNKINNLATKGLYKVAMVRFNPFKDVGGDQSFAIALLNGKNSGITLSSLYTREGTRVYSKTIIEGKSEKYPLTEEEKEAIAKAMEHKSKKL